LGLADYIPTVISPPLQQFIVQLRLAPPRIYSGTQMYIWARILEECLQVQLKITDHKGSANVTDSRGRVLGTNRDLLNWLTGRSANTWYNSVRVAQSAVISPPKEQEDLASRIRVFADNMLECQNTEDIRPLNPSLAWSLASMQRAHKAESK
jgi:hypothetical protein